MNTLKTKLSKHKPLTENIVAKYLSEAGEAENKEIAKRVKKTVEENPHYLLFYVSLAESFYWAGYSKRKSALFKLCYEYFENDKENIFANLGDLAGRLGEYDFEKLLRSWKTVIETIGKDKLPKDDFSAEGLVDLQRNYMTWVSHRLYRKKELKHFGAWTFLAPFKIMAVYRTDLWDKESLDDLTMPLGFQVVKGMKWLKAQGMDIEDKMLVSEEGGFIESIATSTLALGFQKLLAKTADTRTIHINTGLHLLGVKKEE